MTSRNTYIDTKSINMDRWLVVSDSGATRVSNVTPSTKANEIALHLRIELPRALFRKPRLSAKVVVPASQDATFEITPTLIDGVAEALREATGLEVIVSRMDGAA
jgi:hypothetical protein